MPIQMGKLGQKILAPTTTPLLNGRLLLRFPEGAMLPPRRSSLMGAEESSEEETRAIIDAGSERMVVLTEEWFTLADHSFPERCKEHLLRNFYQDAQFEQISVQHPKLQVYVAIPSRLELQREAIPILFAMIGHTDNTIQKITFFLNPKAAFDQAGALGLALRMLSTLDVGPRQLELQGGTRQMGPFSLALPEGYALTQKRGIDFEVYRAESVLLWNSDKYSRLSIYTGGHPSYQYRQYGLREPESRKKGKLLGQDIEWQIWKDGEDIRIEAIVPLSLTSSTRPTAVHLFMISSPLQLFNMIKLAETLQFNG